MRRSNVPPTPPPTEADIQPTNTPTTVENLDRLIFQLQLEEKSIAEDRAYIEEIAQLHHTFKMDADICEMHIKIMEAAKLMEEPDDDDDDDDDSSQNIIRSSQEQILSDVATQNGGSNAVVVKQKRPKTTAEELAKAEGVIEKTKNDFLAARYFTTKLALYLKDQEIKLKIKENKLRVGEFLRNVSE